MKDKLKIRLRYFFTMMMVFALLATACKDDDDDNPKPSIDPPTLANASEVEATAFKASWSAVNKADNYLIEVSKNSNFSSTVTGYNKKSVTGTSTTVTGLEGEAKYYFRVYAKDGAAVSKASDAKEVTTTKLIAAPDLKDASDIQDKSFKIDWNAVTGAEKYLMDVSTKSDFSTTVSGYKQKEINGTNTTVSGLTTKTKYYVRVHSKKGNDISKPSSVQEVTTI